MASINYAAREISVKIVYYGPGLSGKTTNLQIIHRKVPPEYKSDMVSLATETDRTLFFDFLPLDLGKIKGFSTKFQLYTVPGQVYYNATRKLVLRGVDGVVFVADSAPDKMAENHESFQNLEENLAEYGYKRESIPIILQYNKRDLPNALPVEEIQRQFNKYNLPFSEAVANKGIGVFDSLKLIGKIVIDYLNRKYSRPVRPGIAGQPQSQPTRPAVAPTQQQAPPMRQQPQPQHFQGFQQNTPGYPPPPVSGNNAQNAFPQQPFRPPQQHYQGLQQPIQHQMPRPVQPQQPLAPQQMMPTPSHLQARQFPTQPPQNQQAGFQRQPGFTFPGQPMPQLRPQQGSAPLYKQPTQPPQMRVPNQSIPPQQPIAPQSNPQFQQNFQNPPNQRPVDPFVNEGSFELDKTPQLHKEPEQTQSNDGYFNYGNVSLNTNDTPPNNQQNDIFSEAQPEQTFEIQNPILNPAQNPIHNPGGKTDLDLEIEKYQKEIEEKQRRIRGQGQTAPSTPPAAPPSMQQAPPPRSQAGQSQAPRAPSIQSNQPRQGSESDYDVYNLELSGYPGSNQPPTQRQPAIPQPEADDDMYFTSINTDRQKKPIKKPVNPRTQQQKGFLSKFFNGNNRDVPE